jgi:hypothetical protein
MKIPDPINRSIEYLKTFWQWFIKRKLAVAIFVLFTLLLPAYALWVTVFMPLRDAGHLAPHVNASEVKEDSTLLQMEPEEQTMQKILMVENLEMERAYLENRLHLARNSDSVYMSVNLDDSLVHLEINGVEVRNCRISGITASKRLSRIGHEQLWAWLSEPFELDTDMSTIPKIPYVIKEAPKDTLEAQAQSAKPMPVDTSSVMFSLYFKRGLVLEIVQQEDPHAADSKIIKKYQKAQKQVKRREALRAVFRGQPPTLPIHIRLEVSQADARAIYRGIPVNAMLALKL